MNGHSILVVEDDPDVNALVGAYAQLCGYEYRSALTGSQGLAAARALLLSPLGPVARAGDNANPVRVSFEFFPPKTDKAEETLWEAVRRLEPLNPAFVSVTWVPFMALGVAEWLATGHVPAALAELALHVRLLLAVPLSLFAERVLEERCASTLERVRKQLLGADATRQKPSVAARAKRAKRFMV